MHHFIFQLQKALMQLSLSVLLRRVGKQILYLCPFQQTLPLYEIQGYRKNRNFHG